METSVDTTVDTSVKTKPRSTFRLFSRKKHRDVLAITRPTNVGLNVLLAFFCILTLIPVYVIVISSITSEASLAANGYRLWPEEFSGMAYRFLFSQGSIVITAYKNTIISTVAGTILSVVMVGLYVQSGVRILVQKRS